MVGDPTTSREQGKHDEDNMENRFNMMTKNQHKVNCLFAFTSKEAKYVRAVFFCD